MGDRSPLDIRNMQLSPKHREIFAHVIAGKTPAVALKGGKGSGKSLLVAYMAVFICLTRPRAQVVIAMDTHKSLNDVLQPFLWQICEGAGAVWRETKGEWWFTQGPGAGGIVRLRHLDMCGDPALGGSPLEGGNLDALFIDECGKVHSGYFTVGLERTRNFRPGCPPPIAVFSGLAFNAWHVAMCQARGWPTWTLRTADNMHLPADYEAKLRQGYTERQARAWLDGEELTLEGAIYQEFDPHPEEEGGSITSRPIDRARSQFLLVVDPGLHMPFATLFARVVTGGPWIIVDCWAPDAASGGYSPGQMARMIMSDGAGFHGCRLRRDWRPGDSKWPIDDAAMDPAARRKLDEPAARAQLDVWALPQPEGIGMRPRVNSDPRKTPVRTGIERTQLAFERRRLLMSADLYARCRADPPERRNILRCIEGYRWNPDTRIDEPVKGDGNDDGADTVRYAVMATELWDLGATMGDITSAWANLRTGSAAHQMR